MKYVVLKYMNNKDKLNIVKMLLSSNSEREIRYCMELLKEIRVSLRQKLGTLEDSDSE